MAAADAAKATALSAPAPSPVAIISQLKYPRGAPHDSGRAVQSSLACTVSYGPHSSQLRSAREPRKCAKVSAFSGERIVWAHE